MSPPYSPGRKRPAPLPLGLEDAAFTALAQPFVDAGILRGDAARLVDLVAPRYGERDPAVLVALALVLEAEERGHGALYLANAEVRLPPPERHGDPSATPPIPSPFSETSESASGGGRQDEPDDTEEEDEASPASALPPVPVLPWAQVVAAPVHASPLVGPWLGPPTPFVLLSEVTPPLLLTRRFADEQSRIAAALAKLATEPAPAPVFDAQTRAATLASFYPDDPDSQGARALGACLDGRLSVITGGPGTGKTFTVLRVLAALLTAHPTLRVALAAPTGKASVRMREAMAEDFEILVNALALDPAVAEAVKRPKPSTVHKLLRIRPDTGTSRYTAERPLPFDLVLIDEASMLDFTLMRKLLEALGPATRLVLLGDRDQLASVEAGTVLADIVAGALAGDDDALARRVVFFEKSYRFRNGPLVAGFARRVQSQRGDTEGSAAHRARLAEASQLLCGTAPALVHTLLDAALVESRHEAERARARAESVTEPVRAHEHALRFTERLDRQRLDTEPLAALARPYREGYVERLAECGRTDAEARAVLDAFDTYRILCTHRAGPRGVTGLNRAIGAAVRTAAEDAWKAKHPERNFPRSGGFYLGLPVLVTENAYDVGLFNGDIGLVLPGRRRGVEVVFPREKGTVQRVRVERLPPWMPAFALTVHKSQGSQFDGVAVILSERRSPIETRELVYTGVTRAKCTVHLVGCAEGLDAALARPVGRVSALRAFLERALQAPPT